ncbi:MAG: hypothetical protein BWK79_02590 [Beggiatoa sp. IS2]|nr:MAG: hypothetical protein BWK79_02590 [Beggiatoa sp. IS2]
MKYLNFDPATQGAEDEEDIQNSSEGLEQQLAMIEAKLAQISSIAEPLQYADFLLEQGLIQLELQQLSEAYETGQEAFTLFANAEAWEGAVQACNIMFSSEQPKSLTALGNGVWLAVTFPIDPELSIVMLEHIVDDTPDDSDGGAIAAATAHYIADLRLEEGSTRENLLFFTNQLLAKVARRHGQVENQTDFEIWFKKLELDAPKDFLGRLAQILEVMVQDDWWIDRDALRAGLPLAH